MQIKYLYLFVGRRLDIYPFNADIYIWNADTCIWNAYISIL